MALIKNKNYNEYTTRTYIQQQEHIYNANIYKMNMKIVVIHTAMFMNIVISIIFEYKKAKKHLT